MNKTKSETNYEKVTALRKYQQPVFDMLGIPAALYFPKMFYRPPTKEELYVSFFKSELQRGQDIFTEMTDRDYVSEDSSRQLYQWKYNPSWEQDYEPSENTPIRYLIPVSELQKIKGIDKIDSMPEHALDCGDDDCGIEAMTMKDLYAIIQNKPVSSKKWLNELIRDKSNQGPLIPK